MTIKTWRNDVLKVCRMCDWYYDRGGNRYRHQCARYGCSVYKAVVCKKIIAIFEKAAELSKKALDDAFFALTGKIRN